MTTSQPINVLFLCKHNWARSILAEALLNHVGRGRFKAFSAGCSPRENQQPHPMALEVLRIAGVPTQALRSKFWDEFSQPDAPRMDLIITVCDNVAEEVCPFWPGHPATAHWGYAALSAAGRTAEQQHEAFRLMLHAIHHRLELLTNLPLAGVDRLVMQARVREMAGLS